MSVLGILYDEAYASAFNMFLRLVSNRKMGKMFKMDPVKNQEKNQVAKQNKKWKDNQI